MISAIEMAYVPPALRRKQEAAPKGKDERSNEPLARQSFDPSAKHDSRSLKDIQKHFWPNWVPEVPTFVRNFQDGSVDAENSDRKPNQHGDTVVRESDISANQENTNTQSRTVSLELSDLTEANVKSDAQCDASHAEREPGESDQSSKSPTQQLKDAAQPDEESAADRNTLSSNDGNGEVAEKSQDTRGADQPVIESIHPHNTLNSTEQSSDTLQYVLLFHDANPRWRSDRIIYVKSALDLLPTSKQDDKAQNQNTPQEPLASNIMIFEQQNGHRTPVSAMFKFIGYFNLAKMQILEPQTPELVRMQEQKWTRTDKFGRNKPINRNAESWKKSLNQRWAVLGFEKNEKATDELKPPQIQTSRRRDTNGETQQERRSVNEMLREMRLKDGS